MPNYYPLMLDVRGRQAIVIGGDRVAAEKAAALAASGAFVSVLSQEFCAELLAQAEQKRVTLRRKAYEPGDLAGAFVVIAATNDLQLIQAIWAETQERGQPVNIVDVPEYCSFILHWSRQAHSPEPGGTLSSGLWYLYPVSCPGPCVSTRERRLLR